MTVRLRDIAENPMVRHECAEALGGIGGPGVEDELSKQVLFMRAATFADYFVRSAILTVIGSFPHELVCLSVRESRQSVGWYDI